MSPFLSERLSIEGKGLRNKLTVITALIFLLPFTIIGYVLYKEDVFPRLDYLTLVVLALLFALILAGVIMLRQIFEKFIAVAVLMKKAETGDIVMMNMQKDTLEMSEIAMSFNRILKRLEDTTKGFEDQTIKLQQEILERKRTEEALQESERRYKKLLDSLNDYIKSRMTEGKGEGG